MRKQDEHLKLSDCSFNDESLSPWIILLTGLGAIYIPSFVDLFKGVWNFEKKFACPHLSDADLNPKCWLLALRGMARSKSQSFTFTHDLIIKLKIIRTT